MEQSNKSSNILHSFKEKYGIAGVFLFIIITFFTYVKAGSFLYLFNMVLIMTLDEIQKILFSVISFELISSFVLTLLGIMTIYFFIRRNNRALVIAFTFLLLQPLVDTITEINYYPENITWGLRPLVIGAITFWIFWNFLGKQTLNYLKNSYEK